MRIGIYINTPPATIGGAFSYQLAIAETFKTLHSPHQFIFILRSDNLLFHTAINAFEQCVLYSPNSGQYRIFEHGKECVNSNFILHQLKIWRNKCYIPSVYNWVQYFWGYIDSYFQRNQTGFLQLCNTLNIKAIYYTSPVLPLAFNIPYYMPVWDLGHLTNSAFPEVSNGRSFRSREVWHLKVLRRAHRIIAESEAGKANIAQYYAIPKHDILVLPLPAGNVSHCATPSNNSTTQLLQKHQLQKDKYILYPAQFWAHKNHYHLLQAFASLAPNLKNELKIVLTGSDQGNRAYLLQTITQLHLNDTVIITGFIDTQDLQILYQNAFCLTMPTFLGPTNMPIIEAMLLGCPVICSDMLGHREQAQDAALYCNPHQSDSIAKCITDLYNDPLLRQTYISKGHHRGKVYHNHYLQSFNTLSASFDDLAAITHTWE